MFIAQKNFELSEGLKQAAKERVANISQQRLTEMGVHFDRVHTRKDEYNYDSPKWFGNMELACDIIQNG